MKTARARGALQRYGVLLVFLGMVIISAWLSPAFLTASNLFNLLRQSSFLIIISIGMLYVILTGGIDLSVGSLLALASVLVAGTQQHLPLATSLLVVTAVGLACGLFNSFLIVKGKVAPFVATLAMMSIARGAAYTYSKGNAIFTTSDAFSGAGQGYVGPVPVPVLIALGVAVLADFVLRRTVFGRTVTAIGSNAEAVRLAGLPEGRYRGAAYVISAMLCFLSGILLTSRLNVGSPMSGQGLELDAIAAVVIGGASLAGGQGNVLNTVIGALTLGLISNILNILGVAAYPQQIIKGLIILIAVIAGSRESMLSLLGNVSGALSGRRRPAESRAVSS